MTEKKDIEKLIDAELAEANEKYPLFHSPHEAFAVLKEECDELADEMEWIKEKLGCIWTLVRQDRDISDEVFYLYNFAIAAVCEGIQVCAMARKALYGATHNWNTDK